jgi:hypothetical protein
MKKLLLLVMAMFLVGLVQVVFAADNVPKMTKEELKTQLGNPDFIILDVRTDHDWQDSSTMIKGAFREDVRKFGSWITKYPKEKTIIFY